MSRSEQTRGVDRAGRRKKRFLSPSEKHESWLQLVCQEVTQNEASAQWQVDRSTIMKIRTVAREGALAALAASRPGSKGKARLRARGGQGGDRSAVGSTQGDGGPPHAGGGKMGLPPAAGHPG